MALSSALQEAAADYLFLLNKHYPEKASIALVGDRYRLSKDERMVLFRGVCSHTKALSRRSKLIGLPSSTEIHLDGYNVLFTLLNYRLGKLLFIGNDGYLRDAGGTHGRLSHPKLFLEVASDFFTYLSQQGFKTVQVYLDAPVSHSALHAGEIRDLLMKKGLGGDCTLCESADYTLKRASAPCIASSDTAIIDALPGPFYDAARSYLETVYQAKFLDLSTWFSPEDTLV